MNKLNKPNANRWGGWSCIDSLIYASITSFEYKSSTALYGLIESKVLPLYVYENLNSISTQLPGQFDVKFLELLT